MFDVLIVILLQTLSAAVLTTHGYCVLCHIRPLHTLETAKVIPRGIITAQLDYCNSSLFGTLARNVNSLLIALNELTRVVCHAPWSTIATELRCQLHWLLVCQRINYKLALLTHTKWAILHTWHLCLKVIDQLADCALQMYPSWH